MTIPTRGANTITNQETVKATARWRDACRKLRTSDRDAIPDTLGPPEVFNDTMGSATERQEYGHLVPNEETGPNSRAVTNRLRMSCAGWRSTPTAREFYQAVHEPTNTKRETAILLTWYHEAHIAEHIEARLEGAYSWRQLARALHRVGLTHGEAARRLNRFARR